MSLEERKLSPPGTPDMPQVRARLAQVRTLDEVHEIVRTTARQLMRAQGATVVLHENGQCFYADEDAISPLWKGERFPVQQCLSGWAMIHRQAAVVHDIAVDDRIPQEVYRPTFVRSLVMVPIGEDEPIGAIGAYWSRPRTAHPKEVARLAGLAQAAYPVMRTLLPAQVTPLTQGLHR